MALALALLLAGGCAERSEPVAGRDPVRIDGTRFHVGGRPWFPSTNFLTAGDPRSVLTHTYLAEGRTDAERAHMRATLLAEGHDAIFVYLLNDGDYGSRTTPYRDAVIGGPFDEAKLRAWRGHLEALLREGLRPVLWLFADDSPTVHEARTSELLRYVTRMEAEFGDLPVMWMLGLELGEYWDLPRVDLLGAHLAALTPHPVGVHQRPGRTHLMRGPWVDFFAYQYRPDKETRDTDWESVYAETLAQRAALPARPFLAAEYAWRVGGREAAARGLAAAFGGAAGTGNGAPAGLGAFMERLPAELAPSREGATLVLSGPDVRATADPATLRFGCEGCASMP